MSSEMRTAWNAASEPYQNLHDIGTESVHYGPWAPLEDELGLLGDVRGVPILEIGCGGGQSSIALARQGAQVTAIDLSDKQLQFARTLADQMAVDVAFHLGTAADLSIVKDGSQALILSVYTFQYVETIAASLAECHRVLQSSGRLLFSLDHPFRDCFFDEEEEESSVFPTRDYFDRGPMRWLFGETNVPIVSYHRTIGDWAELLTSAGFRLLHILEPEPSVEMLDQLWPEDGALSSLRLVPQTIIFVAEKVDVEAKR